MSVSGPQGGTLNWMAPEMLENGDASTEADVWAFGMTALVRISFAPSLEVNRICVGIVHAEKAFP